MARMRKQTEKGARLSFFIVLKDNADADAANLLGFGDCHPQQVLNFPSEAACREAHRLINFLAERIRASKGKGLREQENGEKMRS